MDPTTIQSLIRENAAVIRDNFMEKYIFTTTEAEDNVQSLDDPNNMAAHSNSAGGSTRNQMRGFELIQKVFDLITIQDWLKL